MANTEMIDQLVSDSALKGLDTLNTKLISSYDEMEKLLGQVQELSTGLNKAGNSFTDVSKLIERQTKVEQELNKVTESNIKIRKEIDAVAKENAQTTSNQVKAMETLRNEYNNSAKAIENQTRAANDSSEVFKEARKNIDDQAKNLVILKGVLSGTQQEMRNLDKVYASGGMTIEDYKNKKAELIKQEQQQKQEIREQQNLLKYNTQILNSNIEAYNRLSAQYNKMKIEINNMTDSEIRNGKTKEQLSKEAEELYAQMSRLQEMTGKHTLSVGNYAKGWNGLNFQVNQLVRELPALTMGFNMFFLAISNNLPMFIDEVKKTKTEVAELNAQGMKTVPVWKQVLSGFLSWQTLLVIGITILSKYGNEIINYTKGLLGAKKTNEDLSKAIREQTSLIYKEQYQINSLFDELRKTKKESEEYQVIKDKIISKYGEYLKGLGKEISSLNNIEAAYRAISAAALQAARDRAISAAQDEVFEDYGNNWGDNAPKLIELLKSKGYTQKAIQDYMRNLYNGISMKDDPIFKQMTADIYSNEESAYKSILNARKDFFVEMSKINESFDFGSDNSGKKENALFGTGALGVAKKNLYDFEKKYKDTLQDMSQDELSVFNKEKERLSLIVASLENYGIATKAQLKTERDLLKEREKFLEEEAKLREDNKVKSIQIEAEKYKDIASNIESTSAYINKIGSEMIREFGTGNVDLLSRPLVEASELVKKGWEDAGEGIATVFSSQFGIEDSFGKEIEILVTPIMPDGQILSPSELEDYVDNILNGAEDLLKADTKGIVISVDVDQDGKAGERLHELQEEYYMLKNNISEYESLYELRINAVNTYSQQLQESIEITRKNQIATVNKQMKELGLSEDQGREHIYQINQKADEEITKLDRETNKLRLDIAKDFEKDFIKNAESAMSKRSAAINESLQKDLVLAAKVYEQTMKAANSETERNKITEDYQKERLQIIRQYNNQAYEEEISYLEKVVELTDIGEDEKQNIRDKINELRKKHAKEVADYEIDQFESSAEGATSALEQLSKKIQRILDDQRTKSILETWGMVFDSMTMYYDEQIKSIDALEKREQEYYEDKLKMIDENVEAGLMSEEEADARKRILEETQLEREKQFDEQRKEMQRKQAIWNKANSIVQTTIAGAQAFAVALTAGPILGPILAGIVAGMVAAQIAMIAAQQIPAYAKGTDSHPGGLARVGDGGRPEMVIFPSGEIWKTPATDTYAYLPKGTEVLPDYQKAMSEMMVHPSLLYYDDDSGKMILLHDDVLRHNTREANNQLNSINRGINAIRLNNIYAGNKYGSNNRLTNNIFN